MSHWVVNIYRSDNDRLVREIPLHDVRREDIRRLWEIPSPEPIGSLEVEERHSSYINERSAIGPLKLEAHEVAYVEEYADYWGEASPD